MGSMTLYDPTKLHAEGGDISLKGFTQRQQRRKRKVFQDSGDNSNVVLMPSGGTTIPQI